MPGHVSDVNVKFNEILRQKRTTRVSWVKRKRTMATSHHRSVVLFWQSYGVGQ